MMDIYILGSSGLAKEILFLINEINELSHNYLFRGFIDIEKGEISIGSKKIEVFQESEFLKNNSGSNIAIALGIGFPALSNIIITKFINYFEFPNLIHPTATGDWVNIEMGVGNIITSGCRLTTDIKLGSFNILNLNTTIGHDTIVGSCNIFNPTVNISGGVKIGNNNLIGTSSTVLQNQMIGYNSIIGAGSVVTKDIPDNVVAFGNPCKIIRENK